ncbi:Pleckstrin homology domain [Rhizoctonia solani]|uniref:Pleckstrin homology domain n=1 Tax=Rhizoctonia solani TaxID=456999 RepID=A0A8H7M6A5_9AGAM|nr:Pleckstrin homology domain [Rhizoctonia solani]
MTLESERSTMNDKGKPEARIEQNNTAPQIGVETGRDKALPPPPDEDGGIGLGTPSAHVNGRRDITPRAQIQRDRNITPTPPLPTITPPHRLHSANHRKISARSEHTDRDRTTSYPEMPSILSPPRGRQTALSSPSLSQTGRTLSPSVPPTRQTMIYTTRSQPWLDREQGHLAWESNAEFGGLAQPGPATSHSLGSRDQNQHRERTRRPSAPASPNLKGKAREIEPLPQDTASRRSILGRRPSFWSRKPKSKPELATATLAPNVSSPSSKRSLDVPKAGAGPSRSSTSFEDLMSPRSSTYSPRTGASSRSSVHRINSRPSIDKLSGLHHQSTNNSRLTLPSPRASVESRTSVDLTLPNVRPTSPLFTEFGTYRASVDFAAAGGQASWRGANELKETHNLDGGEDILSGSPIQGLVGSPAQGSPLGTASSSPVPWVNISTSPRASGSSPVPPLAIVAPPSAAPVGSLRSRHGSPIPTGMMSPTTAQRVTFGDNPQPSRTRTGSITAAISNWRGNSGADDEGRGPEPSFSLFGPRPGSAGQAQTQAQVAREQEMKGSALGHSHPSAFGPATDPALTLTLSPPMLSPGSVFASPQPMPLDALSPGIPGTPLTGSQLSLGAPGWGGSSIGHSGGGSQFGSNTNVSGTTTAGASRASSILLRSPLRPRSSTNPPLLRRLSGVFGSANSGGFTRDRSGDMLSPGGRPAEINGVKPGEGSNSGSRPESYKKLMVRAEDDTPVVFLQRLLETVSKSEIASAIASKNDPFHTAALALFMERFNFVYDPLDIALRRLLMDLSLPKETQQIDRVMEAFAKRYTDCNPGLFASDDQAYVLAFSLMMLHTDAFNKNNKNKMTKVDYVKNTRMPGLPSEVLDVSGFTDRVTMTPVLGPTNSGSLLPTKPKIDPYYIITQNLLDPLRVPIESYVPQASPLRYKGTADRLDAVQLRRVFASSVQLEIAGTGAESVRIGVNKFGLLSRKVVLTGSQLLLFRETAWALLDPRQPSPETSSLRPEEVVSLKDAIALYDASYDKYTHVFRFILPTGRQQLIQAADEQDMNEWISRINYASALRSAGVRVREMTMNAEETRATGVAAAVSHVRDQRRGKVSPPSWSNEELDSTQQPGPKIMENRSGLSSEVELDVIVESSDGGMKDTFDEIKAQLAISHPFPMGGLAPPTPDRHQGQSRARARMTTRAEVLLSKIKELEQNINSAQTLLQNELRIARNFAVLSPFQQATRNRIRLAVEALARRVQAVRMDIAKMACHRDVLAADLAAEEEEREQLRTIALAAAREQLLLTVPHEAFAWSFRSTTDYPDPNEDPTLMAKRDTSLTTPEMENEQLAPSPRKSEASLQPRPSFAASVSSRSGISSSGDINFTLAESGTAVAEETEEQAEVWHATRAGRRVSLVELPTIRQAQTCSTHPPAYAV